jgi:hypothetical protein
MSDDGANLKIPAEAAMRAVLGAESEPKRMSDEEFEQMIRTAESTDSYDGCANRAARLVLEYMEANPSTVNLDVWQLYDTLKPTVSEMDRKECLEQTTGFMMGWAVNAARHILKMKPVPNPAIITIEL